jgi:hypothetical protein
MRRFILAAATTFLTFPAFAAMPVGSGDRMSRAVAELAQACRADCLSRAAQSVNVLAPQACEIRCGAAAAFNESMGRSEAVTSGRGVQTASTGVPVPPAPNGHGVIYAARQPSGSFGLVVGEHDRLTAYRIAEQRCTSGGPGCRIIAEFTEACGAVAQGVRRARGAFVMTSDPNTYVVSSVSSGSAASRADAEAEAMAECRSKDPSATCWIAAIQCGSQRD